MEKLIATLIGHAIITAIDTLIVVGILMKMGVI